MPFTLPARLFLLSRSGKNPERFVSKAQTPPEKSTAASSIQQIV